MPDLTTVYDNLHKRVKAFAGTVLSDKDNFNQMKFLYYDIHEAHSQLDITDQQCHDLLSAWVDMVRMCDDIKKEGAHAGESLPLRRQLT